MSQSDSTRSAPVGSRPAEVAITPEGTRAHVANTGDATVSVIDMATKAAIATITVGESSSGVAACPYAAVIATTKTLTVTKSPHPTLKLLSSGATFAVVRPKVQIDKIVKGNLR